jgi:hypothetical protein
MNSFPGGREFLNCWVCMWVAIAVVLSACQSDRTAALGSCGNANSMIRQADGKDSSHVFSILFAFEGGLQLGMDSTVRRVMGPVATHCGIKDWNQYAVHSRLGNEVDYLFFFRKTPYQQFVLNSSDGAPTKGVFAQVKHGTSELSCVDCSLHLPWWTK